MFATSDTIAAIATPPGRGALGIVRLSGPDAARIASALVGRTGPLTPRAATFARVGIGAVHDQVVLTWYPAPHSYTGDDCVELTAHGTPVVLDAIVRAAIGLGARLANPGEFTFRAYVNGRMDLTQAEAVADMAAAVTPRQARAAFEQLDGRLGREIRAFDERVFDLEARLEASLDFPEEGYHFASSRDAAAKIGSIRAQVQSALSSAGEGCLLRDGATVVIAGRPNTGKSSLFNCLLRTERAIVTPHPGTTRDVLIESFDLNGIPITLVDTAGRRAAEDEAEAEGIRRAIGAAERADLELLVLDRSAPLTESDRVWAVDGGADRRLLVANKADLPPAWDTARLGAGVAEVSAKTGEGVDRLSKAILEALGGSTLSEVPRVTNTRHVTLLERAADALHRAEQLASDGAPEEVVLVELTAARHAFEEVTGTRSEDDLLARIFERFCIGK